MPTHPDAIGYISDLGHSEGIPWLEMICDLAASGTTDLNPTDLEILVQLFTKRATYLSQPAPPTAAAAVGAAVAAIERLESIGPFIGFKGLGDYLAASFPKRATIILEPTEAGNPASVKPCKSWHRMMLPADRSITFEAPRPCPRLSPINSLQMLRRNPGRHLALTVSGKLPSSISTPE